MKKKAIEKIPYLTLPRVSRKKNVKYIGVTAMKDVGHERHLFLEIYRNDKAHKEIPVARIVMTKKDFGTYFPEIGNWSRGRITRNTWSDYGLIWRENDPRGWKSPQNLSDENVLQSEKDLERIEKFTSGITVWDKSEWWEFIDRQQENIVCEENSRRRFRKWEIRKQALKERGEQTPELPEKELLECADKVLFHSKHYLYYKKHGARATVACSKCGGVSEGRWKPGQSYENQLWNLIEEPRVGGYGNCPLCGTRGNYIPQGKVKSFCRQRCHLFLGQKYKENGVVLRYVEVEKEWNLELFCGEKGLEMHGAYERMSGVEQARAYFEPGKKLQIDYQKHNPYDGKDFWDDCNLSGLANISIKAAWIMPQTHEALKGTFLQYSALQEFQRAAGEVNPIDYMERYIQTPQLEMLVKLGLTETVRQLVKYHYGIVADENANRVDAFLGIQKEHVKQLIRHQGDEKILRVMQMERRLGQRWTDEQVESLAEMGIENRQITFACQYMTVQQLLNRVAKYAGCEYGTGCSGAVGRLQHTAQTYTDYLQMRLDLGYDMNNTVYQQPRDLWKAHAKMVQEGNKIEGDKRLMEVEEKFPLIRKHYRKMRRKYFYEDENFLIRPARSAEEIVLEGRILHHCVGGNNYLRKHSEGISVILLLRTKQEPDVPYITVEIDGGAFRILQWYGAHDKKPDKENMERWLNAYVNRLKCGGQEAGESVGAVAGDQMLLPAAG